MKLMHKYCADEAFFSMNSFNVEKNTTSCVLS